MKKLFSTLKNLMEFPGGLMVRIPGFHCCGPGSVPGQGAEILQAVWWGQKHTNKASDWGETESGNEVGNVFNASRIKSEFWSLRIIYKLT